MSFSIAQPSPFFSHVIKQYWTIESYIPKGEKHIQRIIPSGLLDLSFYFGDIPTSSDHNKAIHEPTSVTGHLNEFYNLELTGHISLFSIQFTPLGLSLFIDSPINETCNQNIPLKYLFKKSISKLEDYLSAAQTFQERVQIAEAFLISQLGNDKNKENIKRMRHAVGLIDNSKGTYSVENLASETCLSRKQFERVFSRHIGTSPKRFLRTIRFQNALAIKAANPLTSITDIAYQCGYFDQAHMVNDFKKLSGMTPKQYFTECDPFSDYFQ